MKTVEIRLIKSNPFQTREHFDRESIRQLADEIKEQGFWGGAFRARPVDGHYELVFGHRRLEALKLLGYKQIDVDVATVDDQQMALQSLIENLQREGLTDLEKANGIKRLLSFNAAVVNTKKVAEMLGYSVNTINEFVRIAELDAPTQRAAAMAGMSRTAIRTADHIAGPEFVKVAAQHKLNRDDLDEISKEVAKAPDAARSVIRRKLKAGKITKPEQARREVRKLTAPPKSEAPPDLHDVLVRYTVFIKGWRKELRAIAPYREYIDTEPAVAAIFRKEVEGLIADLKPLL